jgi:hypothetical protein
MTASSLVAIIFLGGAKKVSKGKNNAIYIAAKPDFCNGKLVLAYQC